MPNRSYKSFGKQKSNLLSPFLQFPGIVKVILKRQRHYLVLSTLALVNIILAVGLVNNAAFFSQAVDRVVMLQELEAFTSVTGRPPLSTNIYIFPSRRAPITLENAEQLTRHISGALSSEVGLPIRHLGTLVSSGSLMLQPAPDSELFAQGKDYLGNVEAVYITNVASQMEIIEGAEMDEGGESVGPIQVWMHEVMAQAMGINIGEELMMGINLAETKVPVKIAGIWRAVDPEAEFWFNNPNSAFKTSFLVRRNDYAKSVQPMVASGVGEASWYVILDESRITPKEGEKYLNGFDRAQIIIDKFVPGAKMNTPPRDPLKKFVARSSALTVLLIGYNLPAFGILLYFLVLTSAIMAQWQKRETVMLVSRGMSASGVLSLTLIEQIILFIIGYPLGILFGMLIAWTMGYTASFLSFTPRDPLPISLEGISLPLTALALAFSLIARLWPAMRTARSSLVTEERERARPMHKPFWYRYYFDIFLLVPTFYAYDQMVKRGSLAGLITDRPEDLYRDPLLIVVPALFVLTISLVTMRIFAMFMRLVDLIAGFIPWLTIHLALRQLGRQSLDYVQPMLLVIISLAMGVYTLSMAASLDQWAIDRMYYRTGADFIFSPQPVENTSTIIDGSWIPLPQDFLQVKGVQDVTRVGEFRMRIDTGAGREVRGRFLAVDRADFSRVAWFRPDFANEPLGAMMNRLAFSEDGILVSHDFLVKNTLNVGETLPMVVNIENLMSVYSDFTIVGTYNYFPTVYEDTITIIGNLEYISTLTGLTVAHELWVKTEPGTNTKDFVKDINSTFYINAAKIRDTRATINTEQSRMERVGIFGTLTVGFLATALMAVLGLLVYSYASLQERAYRLAVLNAVGLSRGQILTQVVMEYAFLALFGAIAGALIGMLTAELFVPFFRFTGETNAALPPLIPIIANDQLRNLSIIFGVSIVFLEVITISSILRQRLAEILKRVWI
jgi:putative ABC transport system permease protein